MLIKNLTYAIMLVLLPLGFCAKADEKLDAAAKMLGKQDLHITAAAVKNYQPTAGQNVIQCDGNFNLVIGDNIIKSENAVVWLDAETVTSRGITETGYRVKVYLQGGVKTKQGRAAKTSGLQLNVPQIEGAENLVVEFKVEGEVFITAEKRIAEDFRTSQLYRNALLATSQVRRLEIPEIYIAGKTPAAETEVAIGKTAQGRKLVDKDGNVIVIASADEQKQPKEKKNIFESIFGSDEKPEAKPVAAAPKFQYPVNISSLSSQPVEFTSEALADGSKIATITNRFYLWQRQDENGMLLELQADAAVIFYSKKTSADSNGSADTLAAGNTVKAIYLYGDVIITEGLRTIKSDEAYYNLEKKQALAVNAVMRNYDPDMGIPIYMKADRLRQLSEHKFKADNVVLTTSEFYMPQLAMTSSEVVITDSTTVDAQTGELGEQSYDAMMKNVKLKLDGRTIFYWPKYTGALTRPDIPIKKIKIGHDSDWGTFTETEWYLARLLGVKEPKGVDSTLALDYYSERGVGAGVKVDYKRKDYFGNIEGYIIHDKGKDELSRNRQDVEPPRKLRGNFKFQHRQFLPYDWQMTLETSYMSDENCLESFNREEFLTGKEQETLVHLKRLKENWAFSILGKWRINDFADQLEELPSAQYHLKAKSFFDGKVTMYHDDMVGMFRQRIHNQRPIAMDEQKFTAGYSRTEFDFPIKAGNAKVVPFLAGTVGYDDRSGFERSKVDGRNVGFGDETVFIGEAGLRASTQYWKVYPNIKSEKWDINGIRHILKPYSNVTLFAESDDAVQQRDTITFGLLQRWQTKRGAEDNQRTVEWMRLDTSVNLVSNDSSIRRADSPLWNSTLAPLSALSAPEIFNSDSGRYRRYELFGQQRDNITADYIWRISDTTAVLSDMNFDLADREFEQFNIGFARFVLPNLSYYVGARYLRSTVVDGEKGSNALTFAATYKLSPRYTVAFACQHDFDYGDTISSELTLIRRYHRMYYGLTFSMDETLDRQAVVLSIWPQGLGDMSVGSKGYAGITAPENENY